jgi:L-ascorbate metabolism protein UlaG (beta-lactamase superfamily)
LVMPCHYGTWPPIEQDVEAWAKCVRDGGVAEPQVPTPGQSVTLK